MVENVSTYFSTRHSFKLMVTVNCKLSVWISQSVNVRKGHDGQERCNDDGVLPIPHCNLQNVSGSV